eukprot:scaffold129200_cov32-Prasinocladus_malaysianus.AAC.1
MMMATTVGTFGGLRVAVRARVGVWHGTRVPQQLPLLHYARPHDCPLGLSCAPCFQFIHHLSEARNVTSGPIQSRPGFKQHCQMAWHPWP